ncbi:sensor histidine kinase [Alteromonas macleodii]|uniref:sensor histidine kinase n=1 Tax=Alteromonas macleodii TaxID=28108 RepID=UPI000776C187|nr:histidine kinase dimerization/phospho-acceptor domain-containing protein [Alteromonas macleodii]AMN10878.1 histidine kinase [Alteromonas macleodii]|tara:strand:+ start:17647 stop:18966 length:1320 start_codon:yes stop_codon:yes gene_type:complete
MSLRLKLILIIAPVFFLFWVIASYFSVFQLKDEVNQAMDNRLVSTAKMVNNLIVSNQGTPPTFGLASSQPFSDTGSTKGLACKVSSLNGEVIANSHPSELNLPASLPSGFNTVVIDDIDWRVYTLATELHNVVIAERLSERQSIFFEIVLVSALPTLIAIIVSFTIIWFALGRELRPLRLLRKAVTERSPDDLQPIQLEHKLVELTPLINSQNALFKKVEGVIEREKSFTDNAAHELRTPLTGIISQLQVANITKGSSQKNAIKQSLYSATRLKNLIENLLLLARVEADSVLGDVPAWNVNNELDNVFKELGIGSDDIDMQVACNSNITYFPAFAFGIIIKNLVENAREHGETGDPISLVIQETKDTLIIKVQNLALLTDETLEKMTQRFWRDSAARGTGLGLTIVQALIKKLGGSIEFVYVGKKLSVCVQLPLQGEQH